MVVIVSGSQPVNDPSERRALGHRVPRLLQIKIVNDVADRHRRRIRDAEPMHQRFECAIGTVMTELHIRHIERDLSR